MALPKPITRQESYLANIAGEGNPIPVKPITREEQYLEAIANSGGSGGTTVVANPTDAASADLEKLKVGNTTYAIPEGGGTTVVANPADEATAELSKLKVGEVTYSIPEGGGGDADYSTTEKVVGKWIDGKPIYQKTISGTFNNASPCTVFISTGTSNIKQVIDLRGGIHFAGTNSGYYLPYPGSNFDQKLRAMYFDGDGNQVKCQSYATGDKEQIIYVTLQYTKTTD